MTMEEQVYTLKHFDTPLLDFCIAENTSRPSLRIVWHNDRDLPLLPLDLGREPEGFAAESGLSSWLIVKTPACT
ncbi:MAG: hypothetical protein Q4D81_14040 [Eubacteriales bacterium]|nr:hypothetical protein [Eubacteriales bacterium]